MTEQEYTEAAHPIHTGRHDFYQEAMRLVGERESKADLVGLVNWLLAQNARLKEIERERYSSAAKALGIKTSSGRCRCSAGAKSSNCPAHGVEGE